MKKIIKHLNYWLVKFSGIMQVIKSKHWIMLTHNYKACNKIENKFFTSYIFNQNELDTIYWACSQRTGVAHDVELMCANFEKAKELVKK